MSGRNLNEAKAAKNDEFYTQQVDIANELKHYNAHFKGKTVYCNCDDPRASNFFHYFSHKFESLGLKRLIASCYKNQSRDLFSQHDKDKAIWLEYKGDKNGGKVPNIDEIGVYQFEGDGDFRNDENIELLKQADIVVTNPPFSLFREYIAQLMKYKKDFVILGNMNAVTMKEVWPFIRKGRFWLGVTGPSKDMWFGVRKDYPLKEGYGRVDEKGNPQVKMRNTCWFTNLDHRRRHETIKLYRKYSAKDYPEYENYKAIEVAKIKEIPADYDGVMGVPISLLASLNPKQFEIIGMDRDIMWGNIPQYAKDKWAEGGVV